MVSSRLFSAPRSGERPGAEKYEGDGSCPCSLALTCASRGGPAISPTAVGRSPSGVQSPLSTKGGPGFQSSTGLLRARAWRLWRVCTRCCAEADGAVRADPIRPACGEPAPAGTRRVSHGQRASILSPTLVTRLSHRKVSARSAAGPVRSPDHPRPRSCRNRPARALVRGRAWPTACRVLPPGTGKRRRT